MAKTVYYYQCDLANGTARTHGYIEEKAATVGKKVKLLDSDDPNVYWEVIAVADKGLSEEELKKIQGLNRNWFKNDI
jgi:hypothetical protein